MLYLLIRTNSIQYKTVCWGIQRHRAYLFHAFKVSLINPKMAGLSSRSNLLLVHGLVELGAGIGMVFLTSKIFPFTRNASPELLGVVKGFGVAISALGMTALFSVNNHTKGTFIGAFSYHALISLLFASQIIQKVDTQRSISAVVVHGTFTAIFLRALLNYK